LDLIRPMVELAERLTGLSPVEPLPVKAFFVGSGTEAIEAALLFATNWRRSNEIIALRNSYHGRSFGAVGITGNKGWSATSFSPLNVSYALPAYCYRCPLGLTYPDCGVACAEDLRNVIETTTTGEPAVVVSMTLRRDRKSTRLNSSHVAISYAVFCLEKKKTMPVISRVVATCGQRWALATRAPCS